MKILLAILSTCLLVSCTAIISKVPLGNTALKINADEWDGVWSCEKDVLIVKTLDAGKGLLQVGQVLETDGKFTIQQGEITLKKLGDHKFINIPFAKVAEKKELQEKYAGYFLWAMFKRQDDNLIVWIPKAEFIEKQLKDKKLKGKKEGDILILDGSADELAKSLEKQIDLIIEWQQPGVYNRIISQD